MVIDAKLPKWVSKLGITCPKCVLNDFDGAGGRGVAAAAAIEQDEVVVSVPDDAVLMPETCSALDALEEQGLCNVFGDPEANLLGLVLAVMIERQRGTNSRWHAQHFCFPCPKSSTHSPRWRSRQPEELVLHCQVERLSGIPARQPARHAHVLELACPGQLGRHSVA